MAGSDEEFASVFTEGRALAEQIGDRAALATMIAYYGAVRSFFCGSAADYVRYGEEGANIAAEGDDPNLRAALGTLAMFGHHFAGNGTGAIAWCDRVLADTGLDHPLVNRSRAMRRGARRCMPARLA